MTIGFRHAIPVLERAFIARNLSLMLKSGITISEALGFLSSQVRNMGTRVILKDAKRDAESGLQLSKALASHAHAFGNLFIHFVRVGEQTGTLEDSLEYLAKQLERDNSISKRVRAATAYPGLILGIVVVYAAVFAYVIFPKISDLYKDFSSPLPWITKAILGFGGWMKGPGIFALAAIIIMAVILWAIARSSTSLRYRMERLMSSLPIVGSLFRSFLYARIFRILGFFLKSGSTITEALSSAQNAVDSVTAQRAMRTIAASAQEGKSLTASMKQTGIFSPLALQLVDIGERSGSLENTFFYLSDFYDQDVDYATKNITSIMEPVLLIFVGLAVAVVAIAIILPIYQFSASIRAQ